MDSNNNASPMRISGIVMMGLGLLFALAGFAMETTAEFSSTLNIGLLNDQSNRILFGGFTAVVGAILFAAGSIIRELRPSIAESATSEEDA